MTAHTSTINLTIDVVTEDGLDDDLTAKWFADRVAYRLEQVLPSAGIKVRVQSAFIVRKGGEQEPHDPTYDGLTDLQIDALDPAYRGLRGDR